MGDGGVGEQNFLQILGECQTPPILRRACCAWLLTLVLALLMACQPEPCSGVTANCQGHLARTGRSPRPHSFPAHNGVSPPPPRPIGQSVPSSELAFQG